MTRKRRIILFIAFALTFGFIGFYFYPVREFARSVPEDTKEIRKFRKRNEFGNLQTGDIIFQTSQSDQSKAIQSATHSRYSHMGIIYVTGSEYAVFKAVQPVKLTTLDQWINRGKGRHYVVKRLAAATRVLTPETITRLKHTSEKYKGKDYDLYFEWSDDKIYCSELVWKIYKEVTGIEIGALQKLKDFDLTSEPVKAKMKERFGNHIPLKENVISPSAMFESNKLVTVLAR